jgi:hypothetical protein
MTIIGYASYITSLGERNSTGCKENGWDTKTINLDAHSFQNLMLIWKI